jgi:hypothetical protein
MTIWFSSCNKRCLVSEGDDLILPPTIRAGPARAGSMFMGIHPPEPIGAEVSVSIAVS